MGSWGSLSVATGEKGNSIDYQNLWQTVSRSNSLLTSLEKEQNLSKILILNFIWGMNCCVSHFVRYH